MIKEFRIIYLIVLICFFVRVEAQQTSFNSLYGFSLSRINQLTDSNYTNKYSFCINSLHNPFELVDSSLKSIKIIYHPHSTVFLNKSFFKWSNIKIDNVYNSNHPYSLSDGSMIPAEGLQTRVSAGFFYKKSNLSIQFQPEIVFAQNNSFETFHSEYNDYIWYQYYQVLNRIDMPEQFGMKSYKKVFLGQSFIKYAVKNISIGISTENIIWGPGIRNNLIMSNTAPGFLHLSFNNIKPIKTSVGGFEFQVIAGKLNNSGIPPPDTNRYINGVRLYQPKINEWRYISGIALSWQPKWVKGLFLGLTKTSYEYHSDVSIADVLPLQGIIKSSSENSGRKSSMGSLFLRYILDEERAEIYAEYGRSDKSASPINLIADKNYPRGFVFGFRKLSNPTSRKSYFVFTVELADLQLPTQSLINNYKSWYLDSYVRQGYTNEGQLLGAGIGPGGNSQTIDISWKNNTSIVGLQFERVLHNNDFYYAAFGPLGDYSRHWVDLSTTLHSNWDFKRFQLYSSLALIRSLNYEWWSIDFNNMGYFTHGNDFLNFHGKLGISYRL